MSKTSDSFNTYYKFNKINEESPIIFIHGIGLTNGIWDQQIEFFKKYNNYFYYQYLEISYILKNSKLSKHDKKQE